MSALNTARPGLFFIVFFSFFCSLWAQENNPRLIDIASLDQLDAIRYDLDGDGVPSDGNEIAYREVFRLAEGENSTCPEGCLGYELTRDLDFEDPGSYSGALNPFWIAPAAGGLGGGWTPIDTIYIDSGLFSAVFDGNGHTISNLYVGLSSGTRRHFGLFGYLDLGGEIRNVKITGAVALTRPFLFTNVGALVAISKGTVRSSYASVSIRVTEGERTSVGGLVGENDGGQDTQQLLHRGDPHFSYDRRWYGWSCGVQR